MYLFQVLKLVLVLVSLCDTCVLCLLVHACSCVFMCSLVVDGVIDPSDSLRDWSCCLAVLRPYNYSSCYDLITTSHVTIS